MPKPDSALTRSLIELMLAKKGNGTPNGCPTFNWDAAIDCCVRILQESSDKQPLTLQYLKSLNNDPAVRAAVYDPTKSIPAWIDEAAVGACAEAMGFDFYTTLKIIEFYMNAKIDQPSEISVVEKHGFSKVVTCSYDGEEYLAFLPDEIAPYLRTTEPVLSKHGAAEALSKAILEAHTKWQAQYQGVGHVD